jgi:hypothetical protein
MCSRGFQAKCFGKTKTWMKTGTFSPLKVWNFYFKQFLNLQVFGDLDLNYVFHLYSRFVGG